MAAETETWRSVSLEEARRLLEESDLPTGDLDEDVLDTFIAAGPPDRAVAVGGYQPLGDGVGLLRSVTVASSHRDGGVGRRLVYELEGRATQRGLHTLYLLTTTAERFFANLGYAAVDRADVHPAVAHTRQLRELCPDSARVMRKHLARR